MSTDVLDVTEKKVQVTLPAGFKHLYDDVYRVRWDLIEFADDGFDPNATQFVYQNPRHIKNGSRLMGKGGSKQEMDELREAIRTEGLKHPLDCRWSSSERQKIQLVGGSRRKRSIDKLRSEKAMCHNPATQSEESADQVYEYIVCHVNEMDDDTALKHAVSSNEQGRPIGEGALVALVRHLRKCGRTDEQIRWSLSKSPTWVKESDEILQLDDKTFESFCQEDINRTVALKLVKIPELQQRLNILGASIRVAEARISADIKKHDAQIDKAKDDEELAQGEIMAAKHTNKSSAKAQKKVRAARDKVSAHEKAKEEILTKRTGKVGTQDLEKAVADTGQESDATPSRRPLSSNKVKKEWLGNIAAWIKAGSKNEDGEDLEISMDDLHFGKVFCEALLSGEENVAKVFKVNARNRERRKKK